MINAFGLGNQSDVYEIIPTIKALSIPGPFIGLHIWHLRFVVTRNGAMNEVPIVEREAGQMTNAEVDEASSKGPRAIEKNETRLDCVEALTRELQDSGFEFFECGEAWFSRRFRRAK